MSGPKSVDEQNEMQCLYCKKKLGLFASRRRPFCSEEHDVAYTAEQADLAMRRVMDPLFTVPVRKDPLLGHAGHKAPGAGANGFGHGALVHAAAPVVSSDPPPLLDPTAPEPPHGEATFQPVIIPQLIDSYILPRLTPRRSALAPATDPGGFTFSVPQATLPVSAEGLIEDAMEPEEAADVEPEPAIGEPGSEAEAGSLDEAAGPSPAEIASQDGTEVLASGEEPGGGSARPVLRTSAGDRRRRMRQRNAPDRQGVA